MTEFLPFPDSEAVASWAMRQAGIASGRVYSSIPATPAFPLVIVERIGGVPAVRQKLDRARLQISVWGNSKSEARDIADQARVALYSLEGTGMTTGGGAPVNAFVTAVRNDLGLFWSPDPDTDRDRYIFGVALYLQS